jgi:PAS domain-containing protein
VSIHPALARARATSPPERQGSRPRVPANRDTDWHGLPPTERVLALQQLVGNQRVARALLARQDGGGSATATLTPPSTAGAAPSSAAATAPAPLRTGIPAWIRDIYVCAGTLTEEQATEMLNGVGPWVVQRFNRCFEFTQSPADARRVHLAGRGRAHMLDWDSAHRQITPATPSGGSVAGESLRHVFYRHRQDQLREIFGVDSIDLVITAAEVAEEAERAEVAEAVRDLMFRANQYAIVETLNVSTSARYQPGGGKTYCNIYAYDVVTAMGGYLPRVWWTDRAWSRIQDGAEIVTPEEYRRLRAEGESVENVVAPIYGQTVSELNANSLNRWMRSEGSGFGWIEAADMNAAQEAANGGSIVIILASNVQASRSGHVSVVLAESGDHQAQRDEDGQVVVPLQSQAGSRNFKYSAEAGAPGSRSREWWSDARHRLGGAWIFGGEIQSPLVTPEDLGVEGIEAE